MKRDEGTRLVRVGVFVAVGLAVLLAMVFLIGRSSGVFSRKAILHARWANTSGLVVGAPVRLAGVDVGIVQRIKFDADPKIKTVEVFFGIDQAFMGRVRQDSVARLTSKGLLGDMLVNVSVGTIDLPPLKNGDEIKSEETMGLAEVAESVQGAVDEVKKVVGHLDVKVQQVLTKDLATDVGRIVHSAAAVVEKVERGDGLVHALVYDPRMTGKVNGILDNVQVVADHLDIAVRRVDSLLAAVQTGEGTLHTLIYDESGKQLVAELEQTARSLSDVAGELKTGHGMLHSLIYEEDKSNLIQNLSAASNTLKHIVAEVDQGKGTVGALLKDPSVYEDLKLILGNVKRSKTLRWLVRYTISQDGLSAGPPPEAPPVATPDPDEK